MAKTILEFTLPFALIDEGEYDIASDGQLIKLKISHEQGLERLKLVTGMQASSSGSGKITVSRDKHGIANVSRVKIELPFLLQQLDPQARKGAGMSIDYMMKRSLSIKQECTKYVNRLIAVIRWHTAQHWLTPITEQEIFSISFSIEEDNGHKSGGILSDAGAGLRFPTKIKSQSQVSDEIKKTLASGIVVSFADNLVLDAVNYFETRRFNEVVINANIAFEVFLDDFLASKYRSEGKSEDEAEKLTRRDFNDGLHKLMRRQFFRSLDHATLIENKEPTYLKFDNIRTKRENAIHHRSRNITEEEAAEVLRQVYEVSAWILSTPSKGS